MFPLLATEYGLREVLLLHFWRATSTKFCYKGSGLTEDIPTFAAHAFYPTLGEQAVDGRIGFDRWHMHFESEYGAFQIPISQLQIHKANGKGEPIYFTDPAQPDLSVYTFDTRVLRLRTLLDAAQTRVQLNAMRSQSEAKRNIRITVGFLVGCVVIAVLATASLRLMVRALVSRIPPKFEQDVGDKFFAELQQEETFIQDTNLQSKIDLAVTPLLASLPTNQIQFRFHIMELPMANAFALPGGHVVVTTGLLKLVDRPEELAGAVAHEIAHVTQKHMFRKVISDMGPALLFQLFMGGQGGLVGVLGAGSQLLMTQGFSQEYELEADAVGWPHLINAHIDPRGLTDMLRKLKTEEDKDRFSDMEIAALRSHPATQKRIERLEAKWKKLKQKSGFIQFETAGTNR
jgi:Zn-dependent protease with chaperone function